MTRIPRIPAFFCLIALASAWPDESAATTLLDCRFESPPSSEDQGGTYTCAVGSASLHFGSNLSGPVFEHMTTGGWDDSGAARFYTHVAAESWNNSYRQLNPGSYESRTQQNLRYLIKFEEGAVRESGGKWHLSDAAGGWRTWYAFASRGCDMGDYIQPDIAFNNTSYVVHFGGATGPCGGYQFCANPATWWDATLSSCNIIDPTIFDYEDYETQWVAIEIERRSDGHYKVYIWTRDGTFQGGYYELDTTMSEDLGPAAIGAYLESEAASGRYFTMDEVQIADEYIGPPDGFFDTTDTCAELGGLDCCTGDETCPGTALGPASDCTGVCCSVQCAPGPSCTDGDGDGYGDPASADCAHPEADCDDGDEDVHPGAAEACNAVDDDCDAQTDEDWPGLGAACTAGVGACEASGQVACLGDGIDAACDAVPGEPSDEVCGNDVDEDCDGVLDNGDCPCTDGDERPCYTGPAGTEGVGECRAGVQTCEAGTWSATCGGEVIPVAEDCADSLDNDCDGDTDVTDSDCEEPCADADGDGHADAVCGGDDCNDGDAASHPGADEICDNGRDDDCDDEVDEDCEGEVNGGCGCGAGVYSPCAQGRIGGSGALAILGLLALIATRRRRS